MLGSFTTPSLQAASGLHGQQTPQMNMKRKRFQGSGVRFCLADLVPMVLTVGQADAKLKDDIKWKTLTWA